MEFQKQKLTREQKRYNLDKKVVEIMKKESKEIKYSTIIFSFVFIGFMWGAYFFAPGMKEAQSDSWFTFLQFAIFFTVVDFVLVYFNIRRRYLFASDKQKRRTHISIIAGVCLFFLSIFFIYAIYNL